VEMALSTPWPSLVPHTCSITSSLALLTSRLRLSLPGTLIYHPYTTDLSWSLSQLFLATGSLCCTQPWSSSGQSSSSNSQLPPAMPQHVELVPSDMYLSRVFRLPSTRTIGIIHTIRTTVHFASLCVYAWLVAGCLGDGSSHN
jgi:hypothetical protein